MTFLCWYLGVGLIGLVTNHVMKTLLETDGSDLLGYLTTFRGLPRTKILVILVLDAILLMIALIFWPVVVYWQIKQLLIVKQNTGRNERNFSVAPAALREELTVTEIEALEMVVDPLGAAPTLPFGHLNGAWRDFLRSQPNESVLWSFTANWQTRWRQKELRSGYVFLLDGYPAAYFLAVLKELPGRSP